MFGILGLAAEIPISAYRQSQTESRSYQSATPEECLGSVAEAFGF